MSDMKKLFEDNEKLLKAIEELRQDTEDNSTFIRSLWQRVNGSNPPTRAAMSQRGPFHGKPLDEMVSSHDLDLAALEGTIIALGAKVNALAENLDELNTRSLFSAEELRKQSVKLGIDKRGMAWVLSPDGFKSITALIAAISALFSAIGMAYAAWTGHLPLGGGHGP